jgi:hypothetical protein
MLPPPLVDRARAVTLAEAAHMLGMKLPRTGELIAPCPACGGRDRFSINARKQLWNCRGALGGNDSLSLVMHARGLDFRGAVEFLTGERDLPPAPQPRHAPQPAGDDEPQRIAGASDIWHASRDARGSIIDIYMRSRGFDPIADRDALTIRFHPSFKMKLKDGTRVVAPAMVCAIRDIRGVFDRLAGERGDLDEAEARVLMDDELIVGIHTTALLDDGRGKRFGGDSRRIHGVMRGAGVLLGDVWGPLAYGTSVTFVEGVEDARAALALGAGTAIACGSAGAIERFDPIPAIQHVVFALESDLNGASEKSIRTAASRWREHTQDVRVIRSTIGKDLADIFGGAA